MELLPQTLHTYIQPQSPGGRHRYTLHNAAVMQQRCQDNSPSELRAAGQLSLSEMYQS